MCECVGVFVHVAVYVLFMIGQMAFAMREGPYLILGLLIVATGHHLSIKELAVKKFMEY